MDFYSILGVPQEASTDDIKRAYRRLARRYHPGVNPGDRAAEEMFERIVEAYETLVDPGRRRQYDMAGPGGSPAVESASFMFAEFDFSAAKRGAQASTFSELFAEVLHPMPGAGANRPEVGVDLHAAVTISFADSVLGVERQVLVTRQVLCGACGGAGQVAIPEMTCRECQGAGTDSLGAGAHAVLEAVRVVRRRRPTDSRPLRGLRGTGAQRAKRSRCRRGARRHH